MNSQSPRCRISTWNKNECIYLLATNSSNPSLDWTIYKISWNFFQIQNFGRKTVKSSNFLENSSKMVRTYFQDRVTKKGHLAWVGRIFF